MTAGTNGCTFNHYISTGEDSEYFMIRSGSLKLINIEIQGWFYLFEDCIRIDDELATHNGFNTTKTVKKIHRFLFN